MMTDSSTDKPSKALSFLTPTIKDIIVTATLNHNAEFLDHFKLHPERYLLDDERRSMGDYSRYLLHHHLRKGFKGMQEFVVFRKDCGIFLMEFFQTHLMHIKSVKASDLIAYIPKSLSRPYTRPFPLPKNQLPKNLPLGYLYHVVGAIVRGIDMTIADFYVTQQTKDETGTIHIDKIKLDLVKQPLVLSTESVKNASRTEFTKKAGNA